MGAVFQEAFTVLVTTVAASIGAISLTGLLMLIFEDESVVYFLFFLSLIGFVGPVLFMEKMNSTVRYTLLTMGYMLESLPRFIWNSFSGYCSSPFCFTYGRQYQAFPRGF